MTDSYRCDAAIAIVVVVTILLEGPWGLFAIGEGLAVLAVFDAAVEQLQRLFRR